MTTDYLEISDIKELLRQPKRIVIFGHRNPDGDAIGSSLALKYFMQNRGHEVTVIFPTDYPPLYLYFKDIRESLVSVYQKEESKAAVERAEMIFLLDFNELDRIDDMALPVHESKAVKLMIDHHLEPDTSIADFIISDPSASSTAELVYLFLKDLNAENEIDKRIATVLFTGLLTDTGSFKFSTSARLFKIAAALKEKGVDDYHLQNILYNSLTQKQLELIGHCIANRMQVWNELRTGVIALTQEDYQNFEIQRGDTEGIVNYVLMMRHIRIAVFITHQNNRVKLSFRSKGNVSVQKLAQQYFNGGGHRNASGGISHRGLEETVKYLKEILPDYLTEEGLITKTQIES